MSDGKIRDEHGSLVAPVRAHVADSTEFESGDDFTAVAEPGVFAAISEDQHDLETRREIVDAIREVLSESGSD